MLEKAVGRPADKSQKARHDVPWWVWPLSAAAVLALIGCWLQSRRKKETEQDTPRYIPLKHAGRTVKPRAAAPPASASAQEPGRETTAVEPVPDDLQRIAGIGPKIARLFQEQGICTYAQLAATDESRLREILTAAGLQHLARPATWPEQAALAARGDWDALQAPKGRNKRGKDLV